MPPLSKKKIIQIMHFDSCCAFRQAEGGRRQQACGGSFLNLVYHNSLFCYVTNFLPTPRNVCILLINDPPQFNDCTLAAAAPHSACLILLSRQPTIYHTNPKKFFFTV